MALAVLTVWFAYLSYRRGMKADVNGDYFIYWQTGGKFLAGQVFYTPGLVDGGFTYPPFAALFFSLFSWMPFHVSAIVFTFLVNYELWIASLFLVKKLFDEFYPQQNLWLPFGLAALFSIPFYWHNYIWMNSNLPVYCCTLLGIWYYRKERFTLSYLFFWAGTFLKITPVIFLFYAAIKRGPKDWPKIILLVLPFVLLPMFVRGFGTGVQDWCDYYQAFVAPFSKGKVDENIISLGIPALLNKLNSGYAEAGIKPLIHLSAKALKLVTLSIQLLIAGALTLKMIYDRYVKDIKTFSAEDYALIFLITLLLPGRVWGHHHACTSFIYTCVFILLRERKVLFWGFFALCLLTCFITKDTIGQYLCDVLRQYCYVTLVMITAGIVIARYGYWERPAEAESAHKV